MQGGVRVFAHGLQRWVARVARALELTEILVNRPAERELRVELREAKEKRGLRVRAVRDSGRSTTTEDFEAVFGSVAPGRSETGRRQYLMDRFYRAMSNSM